ncbi:MAG: HAD-IIB family hydrolase [Acidobacteria bacterium]|nr:HAD-IIB family hydrolase [Acidobacteriota bacterium]
MRSKLPTASRVLITDIDNTLLGDREGTRALLARMAGAKGRVALGVATGRSLTSATEILKKWSVPSPEVLISSVGAEIHYGPRLDPDRGWEEHIDYRWKRESVASALADVPGLTLQGVDAQGRHKLSYFYDPAKAPSERELRTLLRRANAPANVIMSHGMYLDLLPVRCSKGRAVRYVANRWGLAAEDLLVAGDSGNDEEMLSGDTLAVVVGNYSPELESLRGRPRVYFSNETCAWGILDGLERYRFLEDEVLRDVPQEVPA